MEGEDGDDGVTSDIIADGSARAIATGTALLKVIGTRVRATPRAAAASGNGTVVETNTSSGEGVAGVGTFLQRDSDRRPEAAAPAADGEALVWLWEPAAT